MLEYSDNLILLTDSYKVSHERQYPPGTKKVYSYFESRGGKFKNVVFFGLQYIIKRYLTGQVVTAEKIAEASEILNLHFGRDIFNRKGWEYILEKHDGRLPIIIKAAPEGTVVTGKNVLMTVENTDPECFWLTNYLETLLVQVWYPMTVATNSREMKKVIAKYLQETAGSTQGIENYLVDFGFRGVSSVETAAIGGCAHLTSFTASDTLTAMVFARKYYHSNIAGHSIPAAEHSTITSWGRHGEEDAFRNMLTSFPQGLVAVVSDSYNVFEACEKLWGEKLINEIKERDGKLIVRPDSGDAVEVLLKMLAIFETKFDVTTNAQGFKVLPPYISLIQGDGVQFETVNEIYTALKQNGWCASNVTFGSGGGLLQKHDRDTLKCAFKCSFIEQEVDGVLKHVEVYKDPITDPGKTSKKGRLTLELDEAGDWVTRTQGKGDLDKDHLIEIFVNGELKNDVTLAAVREKCAI